MSLPDSADHAPATTAASAPVGYLPGPPRTNVFAIISLIAAFVLPIVGIIFGYLARAQIRRTQEEGAGLALAGLIVGWVLTALQVAYFAVFLGLFLSMFSHMFTLFSRMPS